MIKNVVLLPKYLIQRSQVVHDPHLNTKIVQGYYAGKKGVEGTGYSLGLTRPANCETQNKSLIGSFTKANFHQDTGDGIDYKKLFKINPPSPRITAKKPSASHFPKHKFGSFTRAHKKWYGHNNINTLKQNEILKDLSFVQAGQSGPSTQTVEIIRNLCSKSPQKKDDNSSPCEDSCPPTKDQEQSKSASNEKTVALTKVDEPRPELKKGESPCKKDDGADNEYAYSPMCPPPGRNFYPSLASTASSKSKPVKNEESKCKASEEIPQAHEEQSKKKKEKPPKPKVEECVKAKSSPIRRGNPPTKVKKKRTRTAQPIDDCPINKSKENAEECQKATSMCPKKGFKCPQLDDNIKKSPSMWERLFGGRRKKKKDVKKENKKKAQKECIPSNEKKKKGKKSPPTPPSSPPPPPNKPKLKDSKKDCAPEKPTKPKKQCEDVVKFEAYGEHWAESSWPASRVLQVGLINDRHSRRAPRYLEYLKQTRWVHTGKLLLGKKTSREGGSSRLIKNKDSGLDSNNTNSTSKTLSYVSRKLSLEHKRYDMDSQKLNMTSKNSSPGTKDNSSDAKATTSISATKNTCNDKSSDAKDAFSESKNLNSSAKGPSPVSMLSTINENKPTSILASKNPCDDNGPCAQALTEANKSIKDSKSDRGGTIDKGINLSVKATDSDTKASSPDNKATSSDNKATSSDNKSTSSDTKATRSDAKAISQDAKATCQDAKAICQDGKTTSQNAKMICPDAKATSPDAKATSPDAKATSPDAKATSPVAKATSPDAKATSTVAKASRPGSSGSNKKPSPKFIPGGEDPRQKIAKENKECPCYCDKQLLKDPALAAWLTKLFQDTPPPKRNPAPLLEEIKAPLCGTKPDNHGPPQWKAWHYVCEPLMRDKKDRPPQSAAPTKGMPNKPQPPFRRRLRGPQKSSESEKKYLDQSSKRICP